MKIAPRTVEGFLRAPDPAVRVVLLYGPDAGLVRERAERLARAVVPDLKDPFRIAELTAETLAQDPARLADEAAALAFTGGRRVVRVYSAGDKLAELFAAFLETPMGEALVVVEAGNLAARSKLRAAFEEADGAAAIGCYADDPQAIEDLVTAMLREAGLKADADALAYLVENLGGDRLLSRREIEKLITYKGAGAITLEDCMAAVGDTSEVTLDDVAYAAAGGDLPGLDRAIGRSLLAGESPIAMLRTASRLFMRLHLVSAQRNGDLAGAIRRERLHFRREPAFRSAVQRWSTAKLARALDLLLQAEQDCKSTGMPDETICRRTLLQLAVAGRGRER